MKNQHLKHIVQLNIAVLFISTSGVLGRYITLPPPVTIWWRCVFAACILGLYVWYKKVPFKILNKKDGRTIVLSAVFFGAHWITYFYALRFSNVAIGMLSLFCYPVITALLEPLFFKTPRNNKHLFLGMVVLVGIYFLTPAIDFSNHTAKGVLFGLVSAVFYALRNILLKQKITQYHGATLMFYQMAIVALILWPVLFVFEAKPAANHWIAIVALALFTTAIGHTLFVKSFKNFSVSAASIMSSIQPVYGILFGLFFLSEIPSVNTLVGGALILATVLVESLRSK